MLEIISELDIKNFKWLFLFACMDINRVKVENYCSYKRTDWVNIGKKLVLVGENNAGKSNFLNALGCFFNFSSRKPHSQSDFHFGNTKESIKIFVEFSDLSNEEESEFREYVFENKLKIKLELPFDSKSEVVDTKSYFVQQEVLKNDDLRRVGDLPPEEAIDLYYEHEEELEPFKTDETWKQESRKSVERVVDAYIESGQAQTKREWVSPRGISGTLEEFLPRWNFYEAERTLDDATKTSNKGSLLYQLLDSSLDQVDEDELEEINKMLSDVQNQVNATETFEPIRELTESLTEKLNSQINHAGSVSIQTELPNIRKFVTRNSEICLDGKRQEKIEDMGTGSKMSFLLACLWEFCERETDQIMLALEEPENDLHPHAQRRLYETLDRLAEQGHYVFLTTHTPELVSFDDINNILRVEKGHEDYSQLHSLSRDVLSEKELENLSARISTEQMEMLFSRGLFVCEGPSEYELIPVFNTLLAENTDVEHFDSLGVTLIEADGKLDIPKYLKLAQEFEIPVVAMLDDDRGEDGGTHYDHHNENIEEIEQHADEYILLEKDLEYALFKEVSADDFYEVLNGLHKIGVIPELHHEREAIRQATRHGDHAGELKNLFDQYESSMSKPMFGSRLAQVADDSCVPKRIEEAIRESIQAIE